MYKYSAICCFTTRSGIRTQGQLTARANGFKEAIAQLHRNGVIHGYTGFYVKSMRKEKVS